MKAVQQFSDNVPGSVPPLNSQTNLWANRKGQRSYEFFSFIYYLIIKFKNKKIKHY